MATRPTILQLIPKLDTGGAERTVVEMSAAITAAGGRALVVAEGGRMADDVRRAGGEIIDLPVASKNPLTMLANSRRLVKLIAEHDIGLLHARSRAPAWSALIAARLAKIPFVTTYHGAYGETNAAKKLYNSVMARADRVIANSQFTADLIRDRYATSPERVVVIPRGIDPAAFDRTTISPDRLDTLRRRWGVTDDTRIVLQAARLTGWKGQRVLIDAAAQLAAMHTARPGPIAVILAGDAQGRNDYAANLVARIAALKLDGWVKLVGHVDDMPAAYALARVTVIASTEPEAFGRSSIEAQAAGSPAIATRLGAPPETIRARPDVPTGTETGWLVPPNDADALAAALSEALSLDDTAHAALAARATAHIAQNFTLARLQSQTLSLYDSLLGTTLAPAFALGPWRGPQL